MLASAADPILKVLTVQCALYLEAYLVPMHMYILWYCVNNFSFPLFIALYALMKKPLGAVIRGAALYYQQVEDRKKVYSCCFQSSAIINVLHVLSPRVLIKDLE